MSDFNIAVEFVLSHEGVYVENIYDLGGSTNFGISLRFLKTISHENLKKYGIFEEPNIDTVKNLTLDQARAIYKGEFWDLAPYDKIYDQGHASYIFDMAVNMGEAHAIKCAQRACWAVQRDWKELLDDGHLGLKTIAALKMAGMFLMPALRAERANYYRSLVAQNPQQKEFINGWYNRTYGE